MTGAGATVPSVTMTGLYHVYGEADSLLYIGVSKHFGVRWQQHAQKQPWWNERRRMTVDWYDTWDEALDAEALAIFGGRPSKPERGNGLRPEGGAARRAA